MLGRLRRVCQTKMHANGTAKCNVNEEVNKLWMDLVDQRQERIALGRTLAACNFNTDSLMSSCVILLII